MALVVHCVVWQNKKEKNKKNYNIDVPSLLLDWPRLLERRGTA